jgi:RNA polymerase sigma-70 factor, ECF subfamily
MPPLPAIYAGKSRAAEFLAEVAFRLVPEARFVETQANRQPALAVYSRDGSTGLWHGSGLLVITPRGSQVCALTRFESHTLKAFGMPSVLAGGDGQLG